MTCSSAYCRKKGHTATLARCGCYIIGTPELSHGNVRLKLKIVRGSCGATVLQVFMFTGAGRDVAVSAPYVSKITWRRVKVVSG